MKQRKKQIGSNIRAFRLEHDISIDELSNMLGLSSAFVGLIERGQRGAKLENLIKMSEIFKVDINELIYDSTNKRKMSENKDSAYGRKLTTISTLAYDLKLQELDFIIATMRSLKKMSGSELEDGDVEVGSDVKYYRKK